MLRFVMPVDPGDWRLTQGADRFLRNAAVRWQTFKKRRPDWDHEHCAFCWATFVDPEDVARYTARRDQAVLTEGFATTAEHPRGEAYCWVCNDCFAELAELVGMHAVP